MGTDTNMRLIFVFLALVVLQVSSSCKDYYSNCEYLSCDSWAFTSTCRKTCGFCHVEGHEYYPIVVIQDHCESHCTREICQDANSPNLVSDNFFPLTRLCFSFTRFFA